MNEIILSGRLLADPQIKSTSYDAEKMVCKFRIAVARKYKKKDGTIPSDFFFCEASADTAAGKFVKDYCHVGDLIGVSGSIENFEYADEAGVERSGSVVRVQSVELYAHPKGKDDTGSKEEGSFSSSEDNPFE